MDDNLLIIFVKYPKPGYVKSRLALNIGDCKAAQVYKTVTEQLISAVGPSSNGNSYDMSVAYSPPTAAEDMKTWLGRSIQLIPQSGANLGERMQKAFSDGFSRGYKSIIIIGSDCPAVTNELIILSLEKLKAHDVVIGPALDGGYYLLGLCRSEPRLFAGIDWSTEHVLKQTIERCTALHRSYVLLPELRDIDRIEDLAYYRALGMLL
jgi:uncharacterized protein